MATMKGSFITNTRKWLVENRTAIVWGFGVPVAIAIAVVVSGM
jgi:hypothetical protein